MRNNLKSIIRFSNYLIFMLFISLLSHTALAEGVRTIVTTDPELDDNNSLLRFLLYSNEVKIEGLVKSSSYFHWKGDGKGSVFLGEDEANRYGRGDCPCTEWRWYDHHIEDVVDAYAQVFENLQVHDDRYPAPETLRNLIVEGNVAFPSDISTPSKGSELIKQALLDNNPKPIYLQVWGGPSTVARALLSIEEEFSAADSWEELHNKVSKKAIIVAFGEQDTSYRDYIAKKWPDVQFWQLASKVWGYSSRNVILAGDEKYLSPEWLEKNIKSKGPLGEIYRVWGDGKQMVAKDIFDHFGYAGVTGSELRKRGYVVWTPVQEKGSWISEGDTTAFLNLLDNGLRSYEDPTWGGWGGRAVQVPSEPSVWVGRDAKDYNEQNAARADYSVARWFGTAQRDIAARLQWSITNEYENANHHPIVQVTDTTIDASAGDWVTLTGTVNDPDGDSVNINWWHYKEAGSYPEAVTILDSNGVNARFKIPKDALVGQTIHIIYEVTDNGEPALTRYQRVIVTVI